MIRTRGGLDARGKRRGPLHRALLAATRGDQMVIDQAISRFDLARREDYGAMLNVHCTALQELKPGWRVEDQSDFQAMLRRLHNDIHVLGLPLPSLQPGIRMSLTGYDRLGAAYVIRGSRLRASALRQRIPPRFVKSYLDFVPQLGWSEFLAQLDAHAGEEYLERLVIRGARTTLAMLAHLLVQVRH